jgi:phosphotransferase system HPr (HPr) family protein
VPSRIVTLPNASGLHARPAALFARVAAGHGCDVRVAKDGREANAKSTLSLLTLDCHKGDAIIISTAGEGDQEALVELVALVESGLGE